MAVNNSHGQLTSQVNLGNIPRNGFDLSYPNYMTGRLGRLYPIRKQLVYPNDNLKGSTNINVQFQPLAVPILNNMAIKKEDFYVPFNVVLSSFDDFISGGEDMDYEGAIPSMSLAQMWTAFYNILDAGLNDSTRLNGLTLLAANGTTDDYGSKIFLGVSLGNAQDYQSFKFSDMDGYGVVSQYMMLDLFDHIEPAMHMIGDILSSAVSSSMTINSVLPLFVPGDAGAVDGVPRVDFDNDKYMKKIEKSYTAYVASLFGAAYGYSKAYYPTETGMAVLHAAYELIKPFFGIGSNLDMLGYNKLRFHEFLYLCLCDIVSKAHEETLVVDSGVNISPLVAMMSEKPQRILELRAVYTIWANNYRDQLLETDFVKPRKSDDITDLELFSLLPMRFRCWHKDAFTTALDNPGTGNVGVPLSTTSIRPGSSTMPDNLYQIMKINSLGEYANIPNIELINKDLSNVVEINIQGESWKLPTSFLSGINNVSITSSSQPLPGFSLYSLDAAQRAQKWLQKALFYGNRIQDFLFTHFGVKFLDARLRLPELLSQSSSMANINAVVNNTTIKTAESETIAGDRSAIAYGDNSSYIERYIEEHGLVISMMSIIPDVAYSNSFNRNLAQLDQFDFAFHEFATLGLQAVYDVEMSQMPVKVVGDGDILTDQPAVFGFQGMYYSDKFNYAEEHGELLDAEDMYTFAREFNMYDPNSRPKLNYLFTHCKPVLDMFVVDDEFSNYFRADIVHDYGVDRNLPAHSIYI